MWLDTVVLRVVDHRIDQQLERRRDLAAVARRIASPAASPPPALAPTIAMRVGSMPSSSALRSAHTQARVAVVERRGVRVFGCEAVLDRHRDAVELLHPPVDAGVDVEAGAEQVAAAVDPVDARPARCLPSAASTRARSGRVHRRSPAPRPRARRSSSAADRPPACSPSSRGSAGCRRDRRTRSRTNPRATPRARRRSRGRCRRRRPWS